ncbi:diguanylate cyclase (GGDEF)-like protein [Cryobacterium sp. MP_M5]|uniref:putative bifunctional diguanylate cyclase/phosphodiesterase n=1 Tax=unclassified Cryobacterium TaxID=2649013 RepID=UPI0018C971F3|nr:MULTISPECIES: EAL domain-containing protein [unclassified Cryobacterium]MBG6059684.1 diguanylate cyclase (GGDEF)-like protein [Cryobacterium sp. MP_M3]MEC5177024.1 diguanylate cyclase (GGDEF)-like protein [Cryobacterium sp. MP_M5]
MGAFSRESAVRTSLSRVLKRPDGIAESTRWHFAVLALVSLVLSLPAAFVSAQGNVAAVLVLLGAALVLAFSCIYVYVSRQVPLWLDLVDVVVITAFGLACPTPTTVVAYVFTAVWFRALYGPTWRSLVRCAFLALALSITVVLWPLAPGHTAAPATEGLFESFPLLFLAVFIARQLGGGLLAREQGTRRDTALAATGSQLLGLTDSVPIRILAWTACTEICAATPGLHLLKAVRDGTGLRIAGAAGGYLTIPVTLPGTVISTTPDPADARVLDSTPLDAAVGATLDWTCVSLRGLHENAWMLVGAPKKIPSDALLSVRDLINQVALALRNSDVHQQLTAQAQYDSLTGLDNRASFTAKLSASLTRHALLDGVHVMFLDLDDFKDVNDVLGHRAGDAALIEVAARLRACTRPDDICARLGGDEFAVVLHGATDLVARDVAQRMVNSLTSPIVIGGRIARVGASVGIATATSEIDIDELVHQADVAMYAAKANGKGQVQVYHRDLLQVDAPRLTLEWQLPGAAAAGELVLHYQPIVSLPETRCTGVEALVRWQHPEHGLLLPGHFIEIAERTGVIVDIGAFVIRQACTDAATWREVHPGIPFDVHVNVSARELDHDDFIEKVLGCLADTGIPADMLVLELTETVILDCPLAIERLRSLAAHGIKIAIDDFGTGYSSLTTLRSLPVDIIKLDMSFVAGALTNPVDRTVINAIVRMSAELGIQTVAEGVECLDEQHFLEGIGTNAAQGYLYARPMPADKYAVWLQNNLHQDATKLGAVLTAPHATV